jgi:hypothetical protein
LPTNHRPSEVAIWLKNGRRTQSNQMPAINDPKEYGDRWNAWWWSMQPNWREPDSPFDMPPEASAASWSNLICGGPNGILLVVLALAWWMKYRTETNSSLIEEAAIDVTWVLAQLILALDAGIKGGKKRELDPDSGDDLSSKRYLILSSLQIKEED